MSEQNTNPQAAPQQNLPVQSQLPQNQPAQNEPVQQNMPPQVQKGKAPVDVLRDGPLKASIWQRELKDRDYFNTELAQTYKDKNGNLRDTHSFDSRDLMRVSELARRAHNRTVQLKREAFKARRQATNDLSPTHTYEK